MNLAARFRTFGRLVATSLLVIALPISTLSVSTSATAASSDDPKTFLLPQFNGENGATGVGVIFDDSQAALSYASEPTTGLYRAGAGQFNTAILGVVRSTLSATGLTIAGSVAGTTGVFSGAVSGTTGTFSGAVSGTTGTFTTGITGGTF